MLYHCHKQPVRLVAIAFRGDRGLELCRYPSDSNYEVAIAFRGDRGLELAQRQTNHLRPV
jgi:hypothetical protein